MIILSWLLWALRDHFCRLEDAKLAAPDRFRNFKMNWEVSALACFALFTDCLIKKKYLTSILPSSKYLFQKKAVCYSWQWVAFKIYVWRCFWIFWLKDFQPSSRNVVFFGAKINEYAEKILFNRASLSSWCRMFEIENA